MVSNIVTRTMDKEGIGLLAMRNLKAKKMIDETKYEIFYWKVQDDETILVKCNNLETDEEEDLVFDLKEDACVCPENFVGYYNYRLSPRNLRQGDAIRIVKEKTSEDDIDWFAYNAIVVLANVKQITYIMFPSRGPMHRYLTARQIYTNGISIYKYKCPDDYEHHDYNTEIWHDDTLT